MEDEELLNENDPIIESTDIFSKKYGGNKKLSKLSKLTDVSSNVGFNTGIGDSSYDAKFLPNIVDSDNGFAKALGKYRASVQPASHMLGNAAMRITNVIPGIIGNFASIEDLGDQFTTDFKAGNVITEWAKAWKQSTDEEFPIYRENPGESLDLGDPAYWIEQGSGLVNSAIEFGITGGILSKSITGLSKIARLKALSQVVAKTPGLKELGIEAAQLGRGSEILFHATVMNGMEGTLTAADTYDTVYEKQLTDYLGQGLSDDEARKKANEDASQGAAATYNANKWAIPLNLISSGMFMKKLPTRGGVVKPGIKTSAKEYLGEGVQEYGEETINFLAGNYGEAVGTKKKYGFNEILNDLGTPEAFESGMLGFLGGIGQTAFTKQAVNRINKTIDPETGEKISIRDYNKKVYNDYKNFVDKLEAVQKEGGISTFTNAFETLTDQVKLKAAYEKAVEEGNTQEAKRIAALSLDVQAYDAFTKGATETLIATYESIRDGEQKENLPDNYKEKATEAIKKIETLEKFYNDSYKYANQKQVYLNKANRYELENYVDEINTEINKVTTSLNNTIVKTRDIFKDIDGVSDSVGYLIDINNIDYNPTKDSSNKELVATFNELQQIIKNSPDYKFLQESKALKDDVVKQLKESLITYNAITTDAYQEAFKERVANSRKSAETEINKNAAKTEAEIKDDEAAKAEADRQADIAAKNAENAQAVADKAQAVADTKENLGIVADNYNEGEVLDLENIFGEEYKGISGTVISVEESADGTKVATIAADNGDILSSEDAITKPTKDVDTDDVYNTDGSAVENTSNEDSVQESKDKADADEAIKDGNKLSDVKLMSTYRDTGRPLKGIPEAYLEYETNPVDKVGTKVYFEISKFIEDGSKKGDNFIKASKIYNDFITNKEISEDDKNFMVDYLPFKAKIDNSDVVYTFLESKPVLKEKVAHLFEGDKLNEELYNKASNDLQEMARDRVKSLSTYNNRTRPLRISLIKQLKDGNDISTLYTTVKGQYGGQIQLDAKGTENSILDLDGINSLDDIDLYVIDGQGQLKDISGDNAKDWYHTKKNWKGSIYMKTKLANGNPFYLNLNFGKVKPKQAEVIFEIYRSLLQKGNRPTSLVTNLSPQIQSLIKKNLKPEIDLIKKTENKPFNEIILSELLDLIFWDGSDKTMSGDKNIKSRLKINYTTKSIEFGDKSYKLNEFTDDKKAEFVDWVSKNKNRNFKFKPKRSDINKALNSTSIDYLQYAIDEKIINTNAKVNQPLFKGFTNLYLTNGVAGGNISKPSTKPVVKPTEPINNESNKADIEIRRQNELFKPFSLQPSTTDSFLLDYRKEGKKIIDEAVKYNASEYILKLIKLASEGRSAKTISEETSLTEKDVRYIRFYLGIPSAGAIGLGVAATDFTQEEQDDFDNWKSEINKINAKYDAELEVLNNSENKSNIVKSNGFNKSTDTNLKYAASVDGNNYYASADSGRVFLSKDLKDINGRTPYVTEQIGKLITDVNLIGKIETNIRGNMFAGAPNITLKKTFENKAENTRISQNNFVPLQENSLSDESVTKNNKPLVKKAPRKKLSKKELIAKAKAAKEALNKKKCNNDGK